MREPCACSMKGGVPPTARKARTGEFTPPGMISCARWKSCSDCLAIAASVPPATSRPVRRQLAGAPSKRVDEVRDVLSDGVNAVAYDLRVAPTAEFECAPRPAGLSEFRQNMAALRVDDLAGHLVACRSGAVTGQIAARARSRIDFVNLATDDQRLGGLRCFVSLLHFELGLQLGLQALDQCGGIGSESGLDGVIRSVALVRQRRGRRIEWQHDDSIIVRRLEGFQNLDLVDVRSPFLIGTRFGRCSLLPPASLQ